MNHYDVIVIGAGSGSIVVEAALDHGLTVALVHTPPYGGTCQNFGCVPSKMLVFPADKIMEIKEAEKLGVHAEVISIDFQAIMERMRAQRKESQDHEQESLQNVEHFQYYPGEGSFIRDYTLQVNGEMVSGEKIFICNGARPMIPSIKGIESIKYLTNENVLELTERPESMIIIGGGYIAAEYGHFFAAMDTKVTILQQNERLLPQQDPEVSELLKNEMGTRMDIITNMRATEVISGQGKYLMKAVNQMTQEEKTFTAQTILLAAGRTSNADRLHVENTGVALDSRGFVKVNEYLETSKKNIWAFGDIIGKYMFKHVANREAEIAWHNAFHDHKARMDYHAIPYAVFSYPQIASVGMTESQAKKSHEILMGTGLYSQTAKGIAMMDEHSFAKAIIDRKTGRILGFHIIGPHASILLQEVINAMASPDGSPAPLFQGLHIHPALPEVVLMTLQNLKEVK
jgi:dihydrolipoamide dehydrogenase